MDRNSLEEPQGALDWQSKYWHKRVKLSVT